MGEAVAAIIVIIAAFLFFGYVRLKEHINEDSKKTLIQRDKNVFDANNALADYLKDLDTKGKTNADYIAQFYAEGKTNDIKNNIESYFNAKISHLPFWKASLNDPNGKEILFMQSRRTYDSEIQQVETASEIIQIAPLYIPLKGTGDKDANYFLKLTLSIGIE